MPPTHGPAPHEPSSSGPAPDEEYGGEGQGAEGQGAEEQGGERQGGEKHGAGEQGTEAQWNETQECQAGRDAAQLPARAPLPDAAHLFHQAPCALLLTDPDGTILRVNRACVAWLGYPRHELTGGMRLQDVLSIGGGVLYQSHCQPLLRLQKAAGDVQIDLVRRDGARVPALLNVARHRFDGGELDVLAIFSAVDRRAFERELQRSRAELQAAQAAREELTDKLRMAVDALAAAECRGDESMTAFRHDLKKPLAPMRSGLELLKVSVPADHAAARLVMLLDRQLRHLADLVDRAADAGVRRPEGDDGEETAEEPRH